MDVERGAQNPGFIGDDGFSKIELRTAETAVTQKDFDPTLELKKLPYTAQPPSTGPEESRQTWSNSWEFLMSCIAMSIGLGNVWRFPFTAYENGGGAFLIPYIIVLFFVGKPFYYIEMIMGQFTSQSSVKMWSAVPAFRGVGWAQMFCMVSVGTYYCSLMSVTLVYLFGSFNAELPWAGCLPEWDNCVDSKRTNITGNSSLLGKRKSSAELYFSKIVLNEKANIDDGIGLPDWKLTLCLFAAWACIFAVLARGVKSSGKAAYFLAIFPYIIMIALLIRAVTLEGAIDGIIFFIKPNWEKLFDPNVWYAAVTQCFFSLSVCFGGVIMYSSYNDFHHNIYRDVIVVTTLDTFTSLMAGVTIFGILGNLAHELGTDDIRHVVKGGTGLAFVSYPDAIAKFDIVPQLFSFLFFVMLYVLGIGSAIALTGGIISIICDQFPKAKYWYVVLGTCLFGFSVGTVYCTPGGQFILGLVDFYAASFIVFCLATLEITGIFWIYGLENVLSDIEFMLKKKPGFYWRFCWAIVTPLILAIILIYTIATLTPLTYDGIYYPDSAYAAGWVLLSFGVLQIPFWMAYTIITNRRLGLYEMFEASFQPTSLWGPRSPTQHTAWKQFKEALRKKKETRTSSRLKQFIYVVFCQEDKLA